MLEIERRISDHSASQFIIDLFSIFENEDELDLDLDLDRIQTLSALLSLILVRVLLLPQQR